MSAVPIAINRLLAVRRLVGARVQLLALAPALVVMVVFKLALSDGGRHVPALAFAQVTVYLAAAGLLLPGVLRRTAVGTAVAAMGGATLATVLWSVRPEATIRQFLLWLLYLGIVTVTASTLHRQRAVQWFADSLAVTAGWLCLVALFMFWGAGNPGMRWYSTFYWPNPFAAFLLLVFPLEVVRYVHASPRDALAHGGLSLLLAIALLLTYSRGAWLSVLAVMPVAAAVLRPPSWPRAAWRTLVLAAAAVAAVAILTRGAAAVPGQDVLDRAVSAADAGDLSIRGRWYFWRSAWAIFVDHPLGTGAGTFGAVYAAYQRDPRSYSVDAHNLYLQTAAEMGVGGLIALGSVLATAGITWFRALRQARDTELYPVVAGAGIALLAFLMHSGIEMNWMFPAGPAMAFALVGMLAASGQVVAGATPERRSSGRLRLGGALVLYLAAAAAVLVWAAQQEYVRGQAFAHAGDWPEAARAYGRAGRWNPLQPRYPAARATALLQMYPQDPEAAEDALRRAIALDAMNASPRLALAVMLMTQPGGATRAVEIESLLRDAIARDPLNRPEAYRFLARLYGDQGQVDEAGRLLRDAVAQYQGRHLARGMTALFLWPEVAGLSQDWAAWLVRQGRAGEAASVLAGILADDPTWIPAYLDLTAVYVRQGRDADARHILAVGLDRAPANEELWLRWQFLQAPRPTPFPL